MNPVDRQQLTEAIAHALWRNYHLRLKRQSLDDARLCADKVAEHLNRCGMIVLRDDPARLHSTPGDD